MKSDTRRISRLTRLRWSLLSFVHKIPEKVFLAVSVCPVCLRHSITVGKRRTRTDYTNEESNFEVSCIDCFEEHDQYWIERWDEYYRSVL